MGANPLPRPNYVQQREQLAHQIVLQATVLIQLYDKAHRLMTKYYGQLPEEAISLAKAEAELERKPLSEKAIKSWYKACVAAFGKYACPAVVEEDPDTYEPLFKYPLVAGLFRFHRQQAGCVYTHYAHLLKQAEIHVLPAISKEESTTWMQDFPPQLHGSGLIRTYTLPLAKYCRRYLKPLFQSILNAQHRLRILQKHYTNTYPEDTDKDITALIREAHHIYHYQQAKNNSLHFFTRPFHWPLRKTGQLGSYLLKHHWIACLAGASALLAGAVMLALGYPSMLDLLWGTLNTGIALNPIATALSSCTLYSVTAFLTTATIFEVCYLSDYKGKKMQKSAIKAAQTEITAINPVKAPAPTKALHNSQCLERGTKPPSPGGSPFAKPLNPWGKAFTHYFKPPSSVVCDTSTPLTNSHCSGAMKSAANY